MPSTFFAFVNPTNSLGLSLRLHLQWLPISTKRLTTTSTYVHPQSYKSCNGELENPISNYLSLPAICDQSLQDGFSQSQLSYNRHRELRENALANYLFIRLS